ncbi:MAG: ABC transporter ATP-binding protein [Alphaproteobacteria bacterium]
MAQISLRKVNKIYNSRGGDVHAVADLDLDVADGEFVALLGPSGCGKTSTLRMIVGLEEISGGDILFDGERVNDLEPQQRNVAMAFETYALYPNFTIEENLAFPLEVRGLPEAERKRKAREIAEVLQLGQILDRKPGELSGGEQQRVSLGRALIRDPDAFILDEVMSHLDAHLKFRMMMDLKEVHRQMGKTIIYVTHDQMEALALADRVAVMDKAVLQQVGTRNELYRTPANVFVADFIGEPPTNFFEVTPRENGAGLVLSVKGSDVEFQVGDERGAAIRRHGVQSLIVGIRPQHFSLGSPGAGASVEACVRMNEYLGEQSILTLVEGDLEMRAMVSPDTSVEKGDNVTLGYAPEDVLVFDGVTQELIN